VTDTYRDRAQSRVPAALLLRRARDAMDTALAHIADTPLGLQERDEIVQETAALVVRLERLHSLLLRDGLSAGGAGKRSGADLTTQAPARPGSLTWATPKQQNPGDRLYQRQFMANCAERSAQRFTNGAHPATAP
jgi:hypothetical protein